jgi:hypothetical protein
LLCMWRDEKAASCQSSDMIGTREAVGSKWCLIIERSAGIAGL